MSRDSQRGQGLCFCYAHEGEQDAIEGKRTAYAQFYGDLTQAGAEVVSRVEQNVLTMTATDSKLAVWWLAKRKPDVYGPKDDAERQDLRKQASAELLDFIRHRVMPGAFHEVLQALASYGDSELDPKRLPCPA